ncbi:putative xylanase 7 [Phaeosphaeriaceae sp. PMI808]|nr:putative xylanase 7 [Phaeosphaeriaceae sp. PMI808]
MLKSIMGFLPALLLSSALLNVAGVVKADNPIIQTLYSADPAPVIVNNRIYLFTTHDEDGAKNFDNRDWRMFSSADMANWQDHGVMMSVATFSWASTRAWAGQVIARNGKFYYYVPVQQRSGAMAIGVGISDSITGPYKDAIGKPLVANNEIDPTVYIDDNGQAYLYWGNPNLWHAKLNADMISISGSPVKVELTTAGFGPRRGNTNSRNTAYEEGPWIYKRNNLWYLIFAANCCSEDIRYSTGPSITGPWTYRGVVMATAGGSFTNHPAIIDFNGTSYFWYHNGALPGGGGYTRSIAVEKFNYNSDGTIPTLTMTTQGPPMIGTLDPYIRQEAETIAFSSGLKTTTASEGGIAVTSISNNDYIKVKGVAFGANGAKSLSVRVASGGGGGKIEVRLGSTTGTLVGTCNVSGTGGAQTWATVTCPISGAKGTSDLFFRFTGSGDNLFNFNWWKFE